MQKILDPDVIQVMLAGRYLDGQDHSNPTAANCRYAGADTGFRGGGDSWPTTPPPTVPPPPPQLIQPHPIMESIYSTMAAAAAVVGRGEHGGVEHCPKSIL